MRIHIVHHIWSLSVGGDAKNLVALAKVQKEWADVSVLTAQEVPGVRADELTAAQIAVHSGISTSDRLRSWIEGNHPHLAIFHRHGRPDQSETQLVACAHAAQVACFEYNTFACVDASTDCFWTGHAHLSRSSMVQYAQRAGKSPMSLLGHAAIGYGVEVPAPFTRQERLQARQTLSIADHKFVFLRIQRPDLRKWDPLPALAVGRLVKQGVNAHFIVMSAPKERIRWVKNYCGENVSLLEQTIDPSVMRIALAASDCLVNYSHIGETFGLALAEGMAHALPVVVNSTPQKDNAQIELCQHNSTGLVANSLSSLAAALRYLATNGDAAKALGQNARRFIGDTFASTFVEARLRRFMIERLRSLGSEIGEQIPEPAMGCDDYRLEQQFIDGAAQRALCQYPCHSAPPVELFDAGLVHLLRTLDAADYALALGPQSLARTLWRRLKRGSLARG